MIKTKQLYLNLGLFMAYETILYVINDKLTASYINLMKNKK